MVDDRADPARAADAPAGRLPPSLRIAVAVGVAETVALLAYAVSILVFELVGETSGIATTDASLAVPVLVALLAVFGLLVAVTTRGLWRRRGIARTPFVVIQAFVVVAAWSLAGGGLAWERVVGIAIVVIAVAAGLATMSPSAAAALDR